MIILHNNKNKVYLAFFLSLVVFGGLMVAWQKFASFDPVEINNDPLAQGLARANIIQDLENGFELGQLELQEWQDQLVKEQKQQALVLSAKEYLNNKASSTSSSTPSTSTATTSIK